MGQLVKGGLLKPLDAYADAYGWNDRWSKTLLDLNRFSADGKQFGTGNLYGVSQMGEIVGVFYNKDKVAAVPKTFAEFEDMLAKAKADGEVPISFGNLDKFGGIHEFQTVQNQFADKQATRDFVFAKDGASFDTPENREAATKLQEWADKGYFTPELQRHRLRPRLAAVRQGQGPVHDRRHLDHLRRAQGAGRQARLLPDAGPRGGRRPGLARRREPAVGDHLEVQERRRGGRVHRLPHQRRGGRRAGRDRQPAGDGGDAQPTAPARPGRLRRLEGRSTTADGLTPYIDYATPTFYDDFSGAVQRLLAGKLEPDAFTKAVQEDYAKFTDTL